MTSRFRPFWGSQALPEDGGISGVLGPGWPLCPAVGQILGRGPGEKEGLNVRRAPIEGCPWLDFWVLGDL